MKKVIVTLVLAVICMVFVVPVQAGMSRVTDGIYYDQGSGKLYLEGRDGQFRSLWDVADYALNLCNQKIAQYQKDACSRSGSCQGFDCFDSAGNCMEANLMTSLTASFDECKTFWQLVDMCANFCDGNQDCKNKNYCAAAGSGSGGGSSRSGSGGHKVGCTAECSRSQSSCSHACSFGSSEDRGDCEDDCRDARRRCDSGCD